MKQGNRYGGLHLVGDLVHGVGAQQQQLSAGGLESLGRLGEQLPSLVPSSLDLQALHIGEVHQRQHEPRRLQTAEAFTDQLVGQPVVLRAGLPAHPAQHPDHPRSVGRHDTSLP